MEFKMLVVDDEEAVTSTLNVAFLNQGYRVIVANSGESAKEEIEKTPFDLILLDIEMPGISGLEVLKYVKEKHPETKVIIVTGYSEYKQKAKKLGCDAFITKPFALSKLSNRITELLKKKDYEEVKETTMGIGMRHIEKGKPLAAILLIERLDEIANVIMNFLNSSQQTGGYYKVFPVDGKDKAVAAQDLIHTDLCMIDLQTASQPADIVEALSKAEYPPKDFIFYFRPDYMKDRVRLSKVKAKHWNGNPFDEKSLKELAEIIKETAIEHGLVKE